MNRFRLGSLCVCVLSAVLLLSTATAEAGVVIFSGYGSPVNTVAISPDGTKVLTGALDHTARLWDASTGAVIRTFTGHTGGVYAVDFSPDGTKVLTGAGAPDNSAKLWDLATGSLIRTFTGHAGDVSAAVFSPDGTRVLTGSSDATSKLWDAGTGTLLRTYSVRPGNWVTSVALSPDGTKVLTGLYDGNALVWDAAGGTVLHTLTGNTWYVLSVAFSPDGTKALTGSGDYTAKLWDVAAGTVTRTFTGHTNGVAAVAFSPDGTKVLTGSWDYTAKLWNLATGALIRTFTGHTNQVNAVAYSPDGSKVLTGGFDTTARLEPITPTGTILVNGDNTATNSTLVTLALSWAPGGGGNVTRMRFSNDGSTWSAWETLKATRAYTLPAGDGYKTVRVQYLDLQNNRSDVYSDYIRLDTVPPTGGIIINRGAATTTSLSVSLGLTWADTGAGVTRMRFSDNGTTWTAWETRKATRTYSLPAGLGNHTVRVQYTDAASNYSPIYNDYIKVVAP